MKQGKINVFANTQVGFRKSVSTVTTSCKDFKKDTTAYLTQTNGPVGRGVFGFGRLGMDYLVDNRNTISLSGSMARGQFKNNDLINIVRDTDYVSYTNADYGNRSSKSTNNFQNYGSTLSFKHNFARANKDISADINYNYCKNDNLNDFATQYFFTNTSPKSPLQYQRSSGGGTSKFFTAQTNFSDPLTAKIKIETSARIAIRKFSSFNDNFVKDATGDFISLPLLNNRYQFTDRVLAAYATFSQQINKFSYNVGVRDENSKYDGTLVTSGKKFSNQYPFSLFPSAFATYELSAKKICR